MWKLQLHPQYKKKKYTLYLEALFKLGWSFSVHRSHEAVDGGQIVPGAKQEEGEADDDEQTSQVHEGVLSDEPPEADATKVHRDVLTLQRQRDGEVSYYWNTNPWYYIQIIIIFFYFYAEERETG